jgi:uncharacterized protein (TIGR02598 family)
MRQPIDSARGFSLVEVVLALGVAAVALVSIIGLLGVALNTSSTAGHDTLMAAMTTEVLNDLRASEFDALWQATPRSVPRANAVQPTSSIAPKDSTYYFTNEGAPFPTADVSNSSKNFALLYQCVVKKTPDTTSQLLPGNPSSPYNQFKLQLTFTWPVSASTDPAKRPNKQTIYASIARY